MFDDCIYMNTLNRELVGMHAYKLQPSLSERMIVYGHGCHTFINFGVKANLKIKQSFYVVLVT